jgi:uncharacterized protein YgbK (DUF1537 family)
VALDLGTFAAETAAVAAVDLDIRDAPPARASAALRGAIPAARGHAGRARDWIVCKIDSRLRGHVEAAVAALCAETADRPTVVCPALPEAGRCLVGGLLREDDRPPVDLLRQLVASGLTAISVTLDVVRSPEALRQRLATAPPGTCLVVDAETRGDLDRLAACLMTLSPRPALACSSGLLRSLPLGDRRTGVTVARRAGSVVWILGSPPALSEAADLAVPRIGAGRTGALSEEGRVEAGRRLDAGEPFVIGAPETGADTVLTGAIVERLAASLPRDLTRAAALVVSGGATARAALTALGLRRLEILGEILPGAPIATTQGPSGDIVIVLRSGGFGMTAPLRGIASLLAAPSA